MSHDPTPFLPLHPLAFRVLMAVHGEPSFGTAIVAKIEESQGAPVLYPANLYRRIRDLLGDGLLEECSGPTGTDPRRTYVKLTSTGKAVAQAEARRLRDLFIDARDADLIGDA